MYGKPNIKPLDLTFNWLFDRVSQEEVYVKYLGFCELNQKFCNPLRNDKDPQCSFYWHEGVLFFNDFAYKKIYTCISVVMESENISYGRALEKVYNLFLGTGESVSKPKVIYRPKETKQYKDIQCKIQPFTKIDVDYLKQFGITREFTKKAKWYSIKQVWINGELTYTYSNYNPCIGYYFSGRWKLYFYLNKEWRFLSNTTKDDIQGWDMLPATGDILIITKSFKDVGTLYEQETSSIAPQAESILLPQHIITELKSRFKKIYSLMDYDNTGILLAWQMRKIYEITPLFFTEGLWKRKQGYRNCKDIADYRKAYGFRETKNLGEVLVRTN